MIPLILLLLFCLFEAGRYLAVSERPRNADVIIVLGGGDGERALEASKLYKKGYAPYVMLSNGGLRNHPSTVEAEKEMGWLKEDGVPESAIIPELQAQSTYGNAVYSKRMMKKHHFKSAIVVSSSFHMRRSHYIFEKVYAGSGIKLIYHAAPTSYYNPDWWWTTKLGWQFTINEYIKLVGYVVIYGLV
ncbi:uncharacterized SAM-binding protein YcdF (DUF218 family) [Pullulanibacillus pueri]|uniref:DUF218 domain-containing protein n=1 Tax=Pullulanibacillus pueri TaxID=1437324 RepID=A0A8J3EL81_9BACL|nr:uncharacterized SAM-binding protein YcdF (DUF218 family) [Pullulanibacillus pueri]GGH79953.1 hypothetical protein GCM10007096_15640 [Pullulanibacillus pueri]